MREHTPAGLVPMSRLPSELRRLREEVRTWSVQTLRPRASAAGRS